jgi:hypothetical protein
LQAQLGCRRALQAWPYTHLALLALLDHFFGDLNYNRGMNRSKEALSLSRLSPSATASHHSLLLLARDGGLDIARFDVCPQVLLTIQDGQPSRLQLNFLIFRTHTPQPLQATFLALFLVALARVHRERRIRALSGA